MRNDMMKVVAEPARGGSSYRIAKGEKIRLQREGIDSVQHEGLGQRWNFDDRRPMRDHLNALRRFLRKQVGRRWDEVYSDICHNAPKGSFLGHHLRELVADEVSDCVTISGEQMYGRRGWKVYPGDLYVCPETSILKVYDDGRERRRHRWQRRNELEMIAIDDYNKYVNIDGIWYAVELADVPGPEVKERPFDVVLKEAVFVIDADAQPYQNRFLRVWGGRFYAAKKLQANSREVSQIKAALAEGKEVLSRSTRAVSSPKRFVRRSRQR